MWIQANQKNYWHVCLIENSFATEPSPAETHEVKLAKAPHERAVAVEIKGL